MLVRIAGDFSHQRQDGFHPTALSFPFLLLFVVLTRSQAQSQGASLESWLQVSQWWGHYLRHLPGGVEWVPWRGISGRIGSKNVSVCGSVSSLSSFEWQFAHWEDAFTASPCGCQTSDIAPIGEEELTCPKTSAVPFSLFWLSAIKLTFHLWL